MQDARCKMQDARCKMQDAGCEGRGSRRLGMSYKELEIWQMARDLAIDIHRMTLQCLPKFEMFEEGTQIRKSSKSVRSNIVEGYGRRRYKMEFVHFLTYAHASCDETVDHLEGLTETGSLKDVALFDDLHRRLELLSAKLNRFIQTVETSHRTGRSRPVDKVVEDA
jgi:four helix bundle protein